MITGVERPDSEGLGIGGRPLLPAILGIGRCGGNWATGILESRRATAMLMGLVTLGRPRTGLILPSGAATGMGALMVCEGATGLGGG
jgi:hypothetical protein